MKKSYEARRNVLNMSAVGIVLLLLCIRIIRLINGLILAIGKGNIGFGTFLYCMPVKHRGQMCTRLTA